MSWCDGLNVMYSQNSYVEILMPTVMVLGGKACERCLGYAAGALMNRVRAHVKETPQGFLAPSFRGGYRAKSMTPRRGLLPNYNATQVLDFQFPEL